MVSAGAVGDLGRGGWQEMELPLTEDTRQASGFGVTPGLRLQIAATGRFLEDKVPGPPACRQPNKELNKSKGKDIRYPAR